MFRVSGHHGDRDPQAEAWVRAVDRGFYDKDRDAAALQRFIDALRARDTLLTAVYDDGATAPSLAAVWPVATFAEFAGEMTVRPGAQLSAHQISDVTVRATHRRRGLLRSMMEASLARAVAAERPVAVLTASEASIYGRFGFAPSAYQVPLRLKVEHGLALRPEAKAFAAAADWRVEELLPRDMEPIHDHVFAAFHQQSTGSVSRAWDDLQRVTGRWAPDGYGAAEDLRAYACFDADGTPVAFATARFGGWDKDPKELQILDFVAADPAAELALWEHLGAHDLVEVLTFSRARVDDPLRWALANPRDLTTKSVEDSVWIRVLDVPQVLAAVDWAADGSVVLAVEDALGYADGRWALTVQGGTARVVEDDAADAGPEVAMSVDTLGALATGAMQPWQAAAVGRVQADPEALLAVNALFGDRRAPMNHTFF
nr:GNAT family N-acetyltransferase [Zhihengliuella flava]